MLLLAFSWKTTFFSFLIVFQILPENLPPSPMENLRKKNCSVLDPPPMKISPILFHPHCKFSRKMSCGELSVANSFKPTFITKRFVFFYFWSFFKSCWKSPPPPKEISSAENFPPWKISLVEPPFPPRENPRDNFPRIIPSENLHL